MKLSADAFIATEKLTHYLLRWRPEDDKSAFLARAGYSAENPDRLRQDLLTQLLPLDAEFLELTEYGPNGAKISRTKEERRLAAPWGAEPAPLLGCVRERA